MDHLGQRTRESSPVSGPILEAANRTAGRGPRLLRRTGTDALDLSTRSARSLRHNQARSPHAQTAGVHEQLQLTASDSSAVDVGIDGRPRAMAPQGADDAGAVQNLHRSGRRLGVEGNVATDVVRPTRTPRPRGVRVASRTGGSRRRAGRWGRRRPHAPRAATCARASRSDVGTPLCRTIVTPVSVPTPGSPASAMLDDGVIVERQGINRCEPHVGGLRFARSRIVRRWSCGGGSSGSSVSPSWPWPSSPRCSWSGCGLGHPVVVDRVRRFNRAVTNPRVLRSAGSPEGRIGVGDPPRRAGVGPIVRDPGGSVRHRRRLRGRVAVRARRRLGAQVVAGGSATLVHEGRRCGGPARSVSTAEIVRELPLSEQRTLRLFGVDRCLRMRPAPVADRLTT